MKRNLALIIIFNHKYDNNIEILERIYSNRFSNIFFLVPFFNGNKENVIPVYENSHYFQGYIAQGFKSFFRQDFDHYFFIADDMILNPIVNENNYSDILKLNNDTSFIPGFIELHKRKQYWTRTEWALNFKPNQKGVEIKKELPDYKTAKSLLKRHKLEIRDLKYNQTRYLPGFKSNLNIKQLLSALKWQITLYLKKKNRYPLPYPVVGSYSDIICVDKTAIQNFIHYCGVFAATNLFVELAIPTALALSAKNVVTEKDLNYQGKAFWANDDKSVLNKYNNNLNALLGDFPKDYLYIHPVKLSKWKTNL